MAKKKVSNEVKTEFPYVKEIEGLGLILIGILGIGRFGPIGRIIRSFAVFLFGTWYLLFLVMCLLIGLIILIKRKKPTYVTSRLIGVYIIIVTILIIAHLDYINDNGINIIPDRMLFCAYLGISTDQYQHFLGSIDENIKAIFNSIEEWIITSKMNSSVIGTRNNQAIKVNLSYDKVGNGLRPNDNAPINFNTALVTNEDIMKKMLANGYDGIGTVENKKDKVVAEIAEFEKE